MIIMLAQILLIAVSACLGLFVFLRPRKVIDIQISFYEKINWRIEPVSMDKELRNTKIMGLFLLLLTLIIIPYVVIFNR